MYSVSQGPTQIVQKTRRGESYAINDNFFLLFLWISNDFFAGLSQKLEQVDMLRDLSRKPSKRGSKSHKAKLEEGSDKTSSDLSNSANSIKMWVEN